MQVQVLLSAPKKNKTNRIISVRFFISWFATGLVTMQGIVCTLRVPLRAVQLAQRFASKLARLCYYARFALYKSCCPHQSKQKRTEIIRFVFSYLWFATGLVTMQGIVCTLRVPLHAADAPLGNNIALLALLRSFYSLQVLLSAPPKSLENSVFSRLLLFIFRCHTAVGGFTA